MRTAKVNLAVVLCGIFGLAACDRAKADLETCRIAMAAKDWAAAETACRRAVDADGKSESGSIAAQWLDVIHRERNPPRQPPLDHSVEPTPAPDPLPTFLTWIAEHKGSLAKLPDPDCETAGATRGLCTVEDGVTEARYFKDAPDAVRFSTHVPGPVTCSALGAVTVMRWGERPGFLGAPGERCEFKSGPLAGLGGIIENNISRARVVNSGVHLFSPSFLARDRDFAASVKQDEAKR